MPKVVIFDFDGTIANTLESILKLFNEVAPAYSLPVIKNSDIEKIRNSSMRELLKTYRLPPWKLLRLVKDIQSKLRQNIQDISIVEGMAEVFQDLKKQGIEIGIVTSNSIKNVELFLKNEGIAELDFIHSESNLFGKGKVLAHLIRQYKLNKENVMYIGDEVRDIEAARKAGIPIIAVTWGFNSKKRLMESDPDYLISEPREIIERLTKSPLFDIVNRAR